MRLALGLLGLGAGVVALGWWARAEYAPHMQSLLQERAAVAVADAVHGVATSVEGRDITVSGLADGPAERDRLIAALDAVRGRRVVNDALNVLPVVAPYTLQADWRDGALSAQGHAPDIAAREALAALGAGTLPLAAGAPDGAWTAAAEAGIATLHELVNGHLALEGRELVVSGLARTPLEGEAAHAALAAALPEGYSGRLELRYRDDGTPARYRLHYAPGTGGLVEGKLPLGVGAGDLAGALGLGGIDNAATQALMGEPGTVPAALAGLRPWLGEVEALDVSVGPEGTQVAAGFGAGADLELLRTAMGADLAAADPAADLTVSQVAAEAEEGSRRINPVSGAEEVLIGGFWLPYVNFQPSPEVCPIEADAVLSARRIGFVTGSARLDARARSAVNALAGVLGPCLREGALQAEIGGHTDSTGSDEANLALSLARAEAVREALIARGVPAEGLSARGYGATQPVADNETEEGRAANRRTAVRWVD